MLRSIERCFGVLMLALMVASAIGCQSKPRMVKLNLGIERHEKLQNRGVEVHLVGVKEGERDKWTQDPPGKYWEPNYHLRVNADDLGLIRRIAEFTPNGQLGPIWVSANDPIWETWEKSGAMHLFIYAQGVAVEGLTGDSQVLKQLPIDSCSYVRRQRVMISIMPSQITVNPPPRAPD
ncbi:MAG: hypothetical protein V3T84_06450 [Phycisphaerales bacterium]